MRSIFLALPLVIASTLAARAAEVPAFDDAALHAVQFVDEHEGWATGDEGVVWHTIDGGTSWERQPTGTRASLRSIHFLTPYIGWLAGREELPQGTGSVGVLLYTSDGGLKWRRMAINLLPGLNYVYFLDGKTGFVLGDGTDGSPSGVHQTTDGGRTWKCLPGTRTTTWLSAQFSDTRTGVFTGAWGRLGLLQQGMLAKADMEEIPGNRSIRSVHVAGTRAYAVGAGGLVLRSRNGGQRWSYAEVPVPAGVRGSWDFHTVACAGSHVWIAGRPGSALLHSADSGQSWDLVKTGQPLPINHVQFLNEKCGWAVGEYGSILATTDGGKSWQVQHRGGQRAAILLVHARPTGLPLDTVAVVGGEDGYLATAVRVVASDPATADQGRATEESRWHEALRKAGGASGETLWSFPLPQHEARSPREDVLKAWETRLGVAPKEELTRQLVLALRIWRPAVVVTDPEGNGSGSPMDGLVAEAMRDAFVQAAKPDAFPEQLATLGLEPWQAGKLYARWEERSSAQVIVDLNEPRARLEGSAREVAEPASALLADAPLTLPRERFFHLVTSKLPGAIGHRDLLDGTNLAPGGAARRTLPSVAVLSPEVEKAARARRNLLAFTEAPATPLTDPQLLLSQVGPMLAGVPDDSAARAAFAVAQQLARAGRWDMARELFLLGLERCPTHARAPEAYRWLVQHAASAEALHRHAANQFRQETLIQNQPTPTPNPRDVPVQREGAEIVGVHYLTRLQNQEEAKQWYQSSLEFATRLGALGPVFANDTATLFSVQAARRHLGDFDGAQQWYNQFVKEHSDGPWRDAAATELWLRDRRGTPPKPVLYCRQVSQRPYLDGNFKDDCWQAIKPTALRNAVGDTLKDYPTTIRMAYDADFLYFTLRCEHPANYHVDPVKVRPHDADVRPYDRVSILLDLDRDYGTFYHLQIDQRGCVCDDCWGDRSWDPRWFVAIQSEPTAWQIEAAIPRAELSSDPITTGTAWACNIVRVLPGRGVQAWSTPADVLPRPEGMGILLFSPGAATQASKPAAGKEPR